MQGFLDLYCGTERVEVHPGYWVDLKRHLSQDDEEAIEKATQRRLVDNKVTGDRWIALETEPQKRMTLLRAISDWNLTDHGGASLPITEASVRSLPAVVVNRLWEAYQALQRTPEEQADADARFPDGDGGGDEVGAGSPAAAEPGAPARGVLDAAGVAGD